MNSNEVWGEVSERRTIAEEGMSSLPMLTSPMVNIKLRMFPNCSGVTLNKPVLVSITAPVKFLYRLNASNPMTEQLTRLEVM